MATQEQLVFQIGSKVKLVKHSVEIVGEIRSARVWGDIDPKYLDSDEIPGLYKPTMGWVQMVRFPIVLSDGTFHRDRHGKPAFGMSYVDVNKLTAA